MESAYERGIKVWEIYTRILSTPRNMFVQLLSHAQLSQIFHDDPDVIDDTNRASIVGSVLSNCSRSIMNRSAKITTMSNANPMSADHWSR